MSLGAAPLVVYRVETDGGRGPYSGGVYWSSKYDYSLYPPPRMTSKPMPYEDGMDMKRFTEANNFAFAAREQIERWFHEGEIEGLRAAGYKLSLYEVDPAEVLLAKNQVAFLREKAKLLTREELPPTKSIPSASTAPVSQSTSPRLVEMILRD